MKRTLTITVDDDWRQVLRAAGRRAASGIEKSQYQGEILNFESVAVFFGHLTERRWQLVRVMLGNGTIGVRELARRLCRDVKRVHEDSAALVALGLLSKDEKGALCCPFDEIHIDIHLKRVPEVA